MEYQIGQVVYSKCGHDKGDVLPVAAVNGQYLTLVDGKRRTLEKPKRKKIKHVQPTSYIEETVAQKLMQHSYLLDAEVRKALKMYQTKQAVNV